MREKLQQAIKAAMLARDAARLSTLRLVSAAIKDRDIAARGEPPGGGPVSDADLLGLLAKLIKQRQESVRLYEQGGRADLAAAERAEIAVISEFLPEQLGEAEAGAAIAAVIAELGASSVRDMGRVMALLRERHAGQMDFAAAGARVKSLLG